MKKRKMMLGMSVVLAVLLIAGGTFAWFTASADPVVNEFEAGTLKLSVKECFNQCDAMNVNPGDTIKKRVIFCNDGTKRMFVRVDLDAAFENENLDLDVVDYEIGEGWIKGEDGLYYYEKSVCPGECTPYLIKGVTFDGEGMDNEYQGEKFTLTVKSEAIQATNGAAEAVWGEDIDIPEMTLVECTPACNH